MKLINVKKGPKSTSGRNRNIINSSKSGNKKRKNIYLILCYMIKIILDQRNFPFFFLSVVQLFIGWWWAKSGNTQTTSKTVSPPPLSTNAKVVFSNNYNLAPCHCTNTVVVLLGTYFGITISQYCQTHTYHRTRCILCSSKKNWE